MSGEPVSKVPAPHHGLPGGARAAPGFLIGVSCMAVRPRGRSNGPFVGVVALAIVAGVASYDFFLADPGVEEPPLRAEAPAPAPAVVDAAPAPAPDPPVPLDESDGLVRNLVAKLSSHPGLAAWLIPDDLVRIFVVVVDNVADGHTPDRHLPPWRPTRRFQTTGSSRELHVDPVSHSRYDTHAEIVAAIEPAAAAKLYHSLRPLIASAYAELGRTGDEFDATVLRALRNLLETPVLEREVRLIHRAPFFEFADPALEDLLPVQKQFLGMGPRNVRAVQASLLEIAEAIGFDVASLPVPEVLR